MPLLKKMKTIFYQEGQSDTDQETIYQFFDKNNIQVDNRYPTVQIDHEDWAAVFFKATNGRYYQEFNSCGYEITLSEMECEDELKDQIKTYLIKCGIN